MQCDSIQEPLCTLVISDLRILVHLGCQEEERFYPQLVSVNIDFTFNSPPLGVITDRLEDTVCYLEVVQHIQSLVQNKQFYLIERLTRDIYITINNLLLHKQNIISYIKVAVHKVAPPVPNMYGGVVFTYCNALQKQKDNK
ncbi:dihydroneopterin aldolase [Orientia tsutsugamushi]|uniref:dihydroneopterin aldolase n=1 Tax=Orientia tsutsugamushi TaxID=784 RepID=UPI000D5A5E4A|nr:Uncharacterised protein [Orientia tsutsugamushi]